MNKIYISLVGLVVVAVVTGFLSTQPDLAGAYASDGEVNGKNILISVDIDGESFTYYIDQREVDDGRIEPVNQGRYRFKSGKQDFEITVTRNNTLTIHLSKINGDQVIELHNINTVPIYYRSEWGDEAEYAALLTDN